MVISVLAMGVSVVVDPPHRSMEISRFAVTRHWLLWSSFVAGLSHRWVSPTIVVTAQTVCLAVRRGGHRAEHGAGVSSSPTQKARSRDEGGCSPPIRSGRSGPHG